MAGLLPVVGYEVPLPSTNGGCHGMADVVDALLQLQKTCDDVMGNINQRVEKLREKYDDLNERAHDCKERVDSLKGIKKALVVLSAPQLPKDIEQAETTGLHANNLKRRRQALQKKVSQMPLPFKSAIDVSIDGSRSADENKRTAATRPFDPAEKFEFSLLMPPRNNEQLSRAAERGLGRLPRQLDSVTSLLLFNTRENVYREYNDINVFSLMRAERADAMNRRKPDGTFREDFSMRVGGAEYDFNPEMDEGHDLLADLANDLPLEDAAIPIGWDEQMVDPEDTIAPTGQKNRGGGGRRRGGGGGGDDDESVAGASNIRSASPNTNNALPKSMAVSAPLPTAGSVPPPPGTIPGANSAPPMPNMPNMVNPAGMGNRPPLPPGVQGPNTNAPPMPGGGGGGALVPSMPNIGGGGGGQPPSMPGMPQPPTSMPQQQQSAGAPTPSSSLPKAPGGGGGMHSALMAAIRGTGGASSLQSSSTAAAAKPAQSTAPAVKNKFAAAMEKRNRAIQGDMSDDDDEPASKPTPAPKPAAKASAAAAAAAAANAAANRLPPPPPPPGQPSSPNNATAPPKSNVPPPPGPPPKPPAPSPYVKSVKLAPDDDW